MTVHRPRLPRNACSNQEMQQSLQPSRSELFGARR
jgi:hypothetical protein